MRQFSEVDYLAANPDVAAAVKNGSFQSGWHHYKLHGEREGRRLWKAKPVFFLHIPKTAGSSINEVFSDRLRSVTHVESREDVFPALSQTPENFDFVSGHINLARCSTLIDMTKWFTFTLLRDPISHVVSHIKWVKTFAGDKYANELSQHPKETQELCACMRDIDINDVAALRSILFAHSQAIQFFDNMQCRFFLDPTDARLTISDARMAIRKTKAIDLVGTSENAEAVVRKVLQRIGLPGRAFPRANVSPLSEMPDFTDRAVKDFYFSLIEQDIVLYDHWR